MKLVVDSNQLRDESLAAFLRFNPRNVAVLPDYAAMEALKGDPVIGMFESMKVLARFHSQVQILKTTMVVCGLSGCSRGLQRRLIDVPRTKDFELFCRNLVHARSGSPLLVSKLKDLGEESRSHMARVEKDALGFADASVKAARLFTTEERGKILAPGSLSPILHKKLLLQVMHLSAFVFNVHPAVKRLPSSEELLNTYIFRSSICHLLLGFKYASDGGVPGKATTRIRNDMVDSHFATYATFFDGLLSADVLTNHLYHATTRVLSRFRTTYLQ